MIRPSDSTILALCDGATQGEWRRKALGGSSTVLLTNKPERNDTRIPTYGFEEDGEHCLAYPFIEDDGETRRDFVNFSHGDAAFLAALSPEVVKALVVEKMAKDVAEAKLRDALAHIAALFVRELNPSNYDHEQVCEMNRNFVEAATIAEAALSAIPAEASEWRTLADAPKNGDVFPIYHVEQERHRYGVWSVEDGGWISTQRGEGWLIREDAVAESGWRWCGFVLPTPHRALKGEQQ